MRRAVAFFCTVIFLFSLTVTAAADDIKSKKEELDGIKQEIKNKREQLDENKREQTEIVNQIQRIEGQLEEKAKELGVLEQELENTRSRLEITRRELQKAVKEAEEYEELMADRLRTIYMNGTSSYLELLLSARSINDFLDRMEMVRRLVAYDNQVLDGLQAYRDNVDQKKNELEEQEGLLALQKERVASQKAEIERKRQERRELLSMLQDQEAAYERDIDELEKTSKELEKKIQDMLRELESKNKQKTQYTGGVLEWPVPGFYRISSPFGYRFHPVSGEWKLHSGIDIGSNYENGTKISIYGQNFVAGADGTVLMACWYGGYGNCVIIDHGGGITTLYAHGSSILVSEGQKVTRGQPVMKVGSTGVSTGAHAHFEVRKNGIPVDPMDYLR